MTWVLLIIGVPLIAVPIVLLSGFAGCAQIAGISDPAPVSPIPPAPTLLSANAAGPTGVTLTWTPDTSALFIVERSLLLGTFAPVPIGLGTSPTSVSGASATDTALAGLTEGTTYRYQLRRSRGDSTPSAPSAIRRVTTFPNTPENLQTTLATAGRVKFRWINRTAADPVEFEIERQTPAGTGGFTLIATLADVSEMDDFDPGQAVLKPGTSHKYRVTAVIAAGFANDVTARVKSAPSVEHLVAIVT